MITGAGVPKFDPGEDEDTVALAVELFKKVTELKWKRNDVCDAFRTRNKKSILIE